MTSLRRALLENLGHLPLPKASLGGYDKLREQANPPALNLDKLRCDLSAVNEGNKRYFIICVAMIVILFVVLIGVVLTNLNKPDIVKVVMAAFGISSAGLITMMIKLWREKSNVELLIFLAINMDSDTLKTVVAVLLKRL